VRCLARDDDLSSELGNPAGKFVKLANWELYRDRKVPTLMKLRGHSDFNGMGRCIEYYRGQRELLLWRRYGEGWCGA